ncbi:uncharacterized protein LOC108740196 isoform X2 [Agrilus planipennis]|uniref:Uncharacterized protein LOC108740196 isoform X2 n=1 Tax=Agrilus planipennis TaxID=224129 RepID=A0A7F5RG72_AGRPL|nr:uncharacterized protein LOC108740196 isoform X2 [Agrilus planipennis]
MDKENGEQTEGGSSSNKISSAPDTLLDAASLFAYWPRSESSGAAAAAAAANAANLFAATGGAYGLAPHPSLPFGMLPPTSSRGMPSYPTATSAAAVYSNAYSNTLSVAASQAASLGIPAASAAWWSMASHLAAQDYLARLQASGLNFPGLPNPADLPYSPLSLSSLTGYPKAKTSKNSSTLSSTASLPKHQSSSVGNTLVKSQKTPAHSINYSSSSMKLNDGRTEQSIYTNTPMPSSRNNTATSNCASSSSKLPSNPGLTIQPSMRIPTSASSSTITSSSGNSNADRRTSKVNEYGYLKNVEKPKSSSPKISPSTASIFTNPLSLANNIDKNSINSNNSPSPGLSSGFPPSILSDPNSILGGVRLPPDTEIIKYTSSIVGPKIPGTTNRGRKKTISLDPPCVSVHPSHGIFGMEKTAKRPKLNIFNQEMKEPSSTPPSVLGNDKVEVIKLQSTNGSPGISPLSLTTNSSFGDSSSDAPLNLSLKPAVTSSSNLSSSSLNSLSNMSANIGMDRISRRKPGPKPRRVIQAPTHLPPGAPSASLQQLFATADSPRPPSRSDEIIQFYSGSTTTTTVSTTTTTITTTNSITTTVSSLATLSSSASIIPMHKDGRPRNLGRGVSKPKKNTVASLLAQSRALGIKPMPILDPNTSMNQQISLLKSNILAAQQLMVEVGGDEKTFNKLLQEKIKGTLSDSNSSTVDASTDSDNHTDSNHTDSEIEAEPLSTLKKQKQYDENMLRVPLAKGWRRETIIRGLGKNGTIKGDISYIAPDSSNKFRQMSDITQYLDYHKVPDLTKENFTFSSRVIIGDYLQPVPVGMGTEGTDCIKLSEEDVIKRLEELKATMRSNLAVEQRIEVARRQQAARAQARLEKEQARIQREMERNEKQEAARKEREARSQQMLEAKRKKQEQIEKHKHEEQLRKQQERELKRQQQAMLKEQMYMQEMNKQREVLFTVELERERRRQHMALVKALEARRKLEARERKKQVLLAEKQANKERKMEQRRIEMEILTEIRKPCEDLELDHKPLPEYNRILGLKLSGKAFSDMLMVFEFLHNFGETLGFDMESLPTLDTLQQALLYNDTNTEAEEELLSVMTHLLVCAIEDPGIPNPVRHTTSLGQTLRQADITHHNLSEILRIYLYANATGEVKSLTGVHFEREREKRVADHHQNGCEMQLTQSGKNATYYELLHENPTWKMSDLLKDKPFLALSPTNKAAILAYLCNELLQNKAVIRQIEGSLDSVVQLKKEKWILDTKIRKLRMLYNRKIRSEATERSINKTDGDATESVTEELPLLHKDDLLDEDENEMSENESVGTQPEEEEDNKLSGEELGKKLEKLVKQSQIHLQSLNAAGHQLRATCFGQDRYWRRYWSLPKAGGVFVEAIESADPEFLEEIQKDEKVNEANINTTTTTHLETEQNDSPPRSPSIDRENNVSSEHSDVSEETEKTLNNNENEHRKTPNRLDLVENGEIGDICERNLDELRKSVDRIVQSLEMGCDYPKKEDQQSENNEENTKPSEIEIDINHANEVVDAEHNDADEIKVKLETEKEESPKKFNLFERLGECMEKANEDKMKSELKMECKEEIKSEILNELKSEIKSEKQEDEDEEKAEAENKWFSILTRDGSTCEELHLTQGNRWDAGGVGICSRENITELKIPVFPPPSNAGYNSCDSPGPLQMTAEESTQLEYIKKHGFPERSEPKVIPRGKRYGWWRIKNEEELKTVIDSLHTRGTRERELRRTILNTMQIMYEDKGNVHIEEGQNDMTTLAPRDYYVEMVEGGAPYPDEPGSWNAAVANRIDLAVFEQLEALEDKVANASMQVKGWRPPTRNGIDIPEGEIIISAKERLAGLEAAIERRYLKPPLGINTGDPNLAVIAQEASGGSTPMQSMPSPDEIPKGLSVWREAVSRAQTAAQLAMCLYSLESSIAWDKSIMKAVSHPSQIDILTNQRARNYNTKLSNCQFCHNGDNEDKLLLCDSCDKGYHTYCFKPRMENIPEGDWYCHECMNKATGERNCIVCGKKQSTTGTRLIFCDLCPRTYHTDCVRPALNKAPRGKWYCSNCISKKPQKKPVKKSTPKVARDSESSDHPPNSPAPSHSSATTNEDKNDQSSDLTNFSNVGSPSSNQGKKDKVSKKIIKELAPCKAILEDLECHDDAWPFLLPVNTKQFPTYKKIIKSPMDLSTIKKRLQEAHYKSKEEFCADVRQIFNNCETFNEDDSPVGKAGHMMRQFFEARWNELCSLHS